MVISILRSLHGFESAEILKNLIATATMKKKLIKTKCSSRK